MGQVDYYNKGLKMMQNVIYSYSSSYTLKFCVFCYFRSQRQCDATKCVNISCDKMTVSPGYDGFDHVSCFIRGFIFIDHEYIFTVFGRGFEQNSTHKMDMKLDHEVCEF